MSFPAAVVEQTANASQWIQLPLVHCLEPGSVHLTGQQIAEIIDAKDAAS